MEVAQTPSNGRLPPFHDHDVHEWSTLDSITGVLERARIETDHWATNTTNASHKYGKVVDSRARTDADGALRQQARRQLEVFQSQVPGGHLQVIKSHSVSSSRWTNKRSEEIKGGEFEGLQIPSNQLDLSFQKSKAVIGRSATRRPPTRIKSKDDTSPTREDNLNRVASANLQRVTRLCHQIHENAVRQAFGKFTNGSPIENRLKLTESSEKHEEDTITSNGHTNLLRTKSSSSEDFLINLNQDKSTKSIEDLEDLEHLQTWRRTSKIRRSLQYPKQEKQFPNKPIDLPETSVNVRKITEDFEKGRRLSTALRGNNIDLQTLDQILQTISCSSSEKPSTPDEEADSPKNSISKSKRNSFVTVESIQEIKGRLRRTSSPEKDIFNKVKDPDTDDGIVTEDPSKPEEKMIDSNRLSGHSKVKSYVFGMDYTKKPIMGTGSLESRSKLLNGTTNRSEDWYNRRKSYGFEPVQNQNDTISSNKKFVESSTDSGICRSSEVIVIPSAIRNHKTDSENHIANSVLNKSSVDTEDRNYGNVKRISSLFDNGITKSNSLRRDHEFSSSWIEKNKENDWSLNPGITIKIPIVSNSQWNENEKEIKRHSIAVDETKYVSKSAINNEARRTSLVINEKFLNIPTTESCDSDSNGFGRKSKKVEFCKTEVHFAAESGKVNIVETDEKPPPTQNFRRRRRNPSYPADFNKNGLPFLHFGENHVEKTLFANGNQYSEDVGSSEETESNSNCRTPSCHGVVTVNSDFNSIGAFEDDRRELGENDNIKGILKNKMVKPKPYHLGENPIDFNFFDEENRNWSTKKFSAKDPPIWKSTVTVSNTLFDQRVTKAIPSNLNNQPDLIKDQLKRLADFNNDLKRIEPVEHKKPFLSVADRIRNMEENQKIDSHRGYSTRVNIGEGQAIVIQNSTLSKNDKISESVPQESKESKTEAQLRPINQHEEPVKIKAEIKNRKFSPIVLRKHPIVIKTAELRSANTSGKLSSPLLVERSFLDVEKLDEKTGIFDVISRSNGTEETTSVHDSLKEDNSQHTFLRNEKVLRQPKISELAYFGVPIKPVADVKDENNKSEMKNNRMKKDIVGPRRCDSPIYQNVSTNLKEAPKASSNFDSGILEELTKAADEILQAVKDYSEEEARKQKELEEIKTELSTITENKTWKRELLKKPIERPCKSKLRNTSSNSSLENTPKESKPTHRYISNTKASADKIKTLTNSGSESSGLKSTTKARRLQRASSREALLQSRGSSSEDLAANEVPLRKPRMVRKTKTTQMSMTNGMEISKKGTVATNAKRKIENSKADERVPGALPEIRHKTAVSTIRSTAERAARDKNKYRSDDTKKKVSQQKEITKASLSPTSPAKSKRDTVTHRLATANIKKYRPDNH